VWLAISSWKVEVLDADRKVPGEACLHLVEHLPCMPVEEA
jgi:hypothetical protein